MGSQGRTAMLMKEGKSCTSARFGANAASVWGEWDLMWERVEEGSSGEAEFIAYNDGSWVYYFWNWGSCAVCDTWHDSTFEAVVHEMREGALTFDEEHMLSEWLRRVCKRDAVTMAAPDISDLYEPGFFDRLMTEARS